MPARSTVGSGLKLAQPIPPESNQPNELLGIRLKPTLQLGSKGPDDSIAHSRADTAAGATPPRRPFTLLSRLGTN